MTATDTTQSDVRTSNPYVGPRSFVEGEKLYGREREINELRSTLLARRIVLLYSPSGAGKTSLVQAGLRPELHGQGFQIWPTARVIYELPSDLDRSRQPNRYLFSTLMSLEEGRPTDQRLGVGELVAASCDGLEALDRYLTDRAVEDRNPFLIFDQFEELFTLDPADWDQKHAFLDGLGQTLRDRSRWALVSMREDYIAQLDPYLDLIPTRFASRYRLDLLEAADAMKAAKGPAVDAGVGFTDQAAERLVGDLRTVLVQHGEDTKSVEGRYVEPVQLQVACHRLWSTLDPHDEEIGIDDVEKVGSADEALADFYSEAVGSVAKETGTSEAAIRTWVEMKLVTVDGFRSQTREGPEKHGPEVLHGLQTAHVIRADRRLGSTWYELSHDRLVKPIRNSNKEWFEDHLSTLQRARQEWVRNGRRGLLLSGEVLAEAEAWERNQPQEALDEDREYLEVCREAERHLALERKVSRRNRLLALVALIVGVLAVFGALVAFALQRRARDAEERAEDALEQKEQAEASQKALNDQNRYLAEADQATDTDQKLERWWIAQAADSRTDTADLTRKMVAVQHYLEHDPVYVADTFDLDRAGRRLARVISGAVEIIDVVTLERQPMPDLPAGAESVSFSPTDDRMMVVGFGEDGRWISVFDLAGRNPTVQLDTTGVGFIDDVQLSGSGGIVVGIASSAAGNVIVVWDASTGQLVEAPDGQAALRVAVSADGSTIASADVDGLLRAWRRAGDAWTTVALPDVLAGVDTDGPLALSVDGRALTYRSVGTDPDVPAETFVVVDDSLPPTTVPLDQGEQLLSAVFLPDGTLRTLEDAGSVRSWHRASRGWQEDLAALRNLPPNVGAVLSAQGTTAALQAVQGIAIYDVESGEQWLGQHAASHGVVRDDRAATVRSSASAGAGLPLPGAVYLMAEEQTWEPVGDTPMVGSVFMDRSGQAVAWISTPSDSADAAEVQIGVHIAGRTSMIPGACGGAAPDSVAVANPPDDESLPMLALSGPGGVCLAGPDGASPFLEELHGEVPRAVALAEDATVVVVGMDVNGVGLVSAYDTEAYRSGAWLGAPLTVLRTGAGQKPLAVGGDEQGNIVVLDTDDTDNVCYMKLPVANPIVAADVMERDGLTFVASATARGVFVHRVTVTGDDCNAELQSGFDLQREEGEVLDLSFRPDGTVTVLESDLFLFGFDPAATPADVATRVSALADQRGWKIPLDVGE